MVAMAERQMLERNDTFNKENGTTIEPKADPRPKDQEKIESFDGEERTKTIFESSTREDDICKGKNKYVCSTT
jgi:hypothetical protein